MRMVGEVLWWVIASRCDYACGWHGSTNAGGGYGVDGADVKLWLARREVKDARGRHMMFSEESSCCGELRGYI
eukprot:SAG11_NODE_2189_length_3707_cov_2.141075_1_plen_73_part_00